VVATFRTIWTIKDVEDRVVHNLFSINFVWTLVTGSSSCSCRLGSPAWKPASAVPRTPSHTFAMNLMIYPLGCLAFWMYGFAVGWGNWFNGPVGPGWYPSLGPGLGLLNEGIGIKGTADAANAGLFQYGLMGTKGFS